MGILWWRKNTTAATTTANNNDQPTNPPQINNNQSSTTSGGQVAGMNGAEEVKRINPVDVAVFEFGSVSASTDKVTLAGYCPVSDELEPCRWEILPAQESDAPQFRLVF